MDLARRAHGELEESTLVEAGRVAAQAERERTCTTSKRPIVGGLEPRQQGCVGRHLDLGASPRPHRDVEGEGSIRHGGLAARAVDARVHDGLARIAHGAVARAGQEPELLLLRAPEQRALVAQRAAYQGGGELAITGLPGRQGERQGGGRLLGVTRGLRELEQLTRTARHEVGACDAEHGETVQIRRVGQQERRRRARQSGVVLRQVAQHPTQPGQRRRERSRERVSLALLRGRGHDASRRERGHGRCARVAAELAGEAICHALTRRPRLLVVQQAADGHEAGGRLDQRIASADETARLGSQQPGAQLGRQPVAAHGHREGVEPR